MRTSLIAAALSLPLALPALADSHSTDTPDMQPFAAAEVSGPEGIAGSVSLHETGSGMVLARLNLTDVPPGLHGVHLHETGDCSADDFKSAGGHIAGDRKHGVLVDGGPHPGDMPNVEVTEDGLLKAEVFLPHLDLETMIADEDGAAFIVHADPDDYSSQPSGAAGSRIACGVFEVK